MLVLSESVFPVTQARGLSPHQRSNSSCSSSASASYSESSASEGESAREHEKESAGRALSDRGRGKPVSSLTNQLARPTAAYTRKERASDRPLKQLTIEQTLPVFEDYLFDMDRSDASENEEPKSKGPSTSSSAATAAKENAGKHPAKSKRSLATSQPAEKKDVEIAGSVESTLNRDALLLLIQKLSAGGIPQTKKPAPPRKATGTAAAKKPATRKRPAPTKAAAPARGKQTRRAASSSSSSSSSDSTGTSESSGDSSDSGSSDWQSAGNRQEGRSKKRGGDKKSEKKIKDNDVMAAQKKRKTKSSSHKKKSGRAGGKRKGLSTKERVNLRRMIAKAFGRRK